jgi:hypothetical protein
VATDVVTSIFFSYEGHSLSMLRRVAAALHARVRVVLEPLPEPHKDSFPRHAIFPLSPGDAASR